MKDILEEIKTYKLKDIKAAKIKTPVSCLEEQAQDQHPTRGFENVLREKQKTSCLLAGPAGWACPAYCTIQYLF